MTRSAAVSYSHILLLLLVLAATVNNIVVAAQNVAKESSLLPPLKPPTTTAAAETLLPKKLPDLPLHLLPAVSGGGGGDSLSNGYYLNSCPNVEAIIHRKVESWFQKDNTIAASLIRLHFHDCAVRGCDASILLNQPGSERSAKASNSLRGFEVIDDIKAEVEKQCPKTVSCADILTAAARDATVKREGPFWEVPFGRTDGRVSVAREAEMVPIGHENILYIKIYLLCVYIFFRFLKFRSILVI